MKEFVNFDALTSYFKKHAKKGAKLLKIARIVSVLWTLFAVIATVWSLIPKYEKMPDSVDAQTVLDEISINGKPEPDLEQAQEDLEKEIQHGNI